MKEPPAPNERHHAFWLVPILAASILLGVLASESQPQRKVARIGYLDGGSPTPEFLPFLEAFRRGLRELGYIEGQNLAIEYRWAEGRYERLPELAAELVRLRVDIIVVGIAQAARAAKQATTTIPIVMVAVIDPVGFGLVKSLARPGGNITGLSSLNPEMVAKHLELLKETIPRVSRVAVLWNAANPVEVRLWRARKAAAQALGLRLIDVEVQTPDDFAAAFSVIARERPEAMLLVGDPLILGQRRPIVEFAEKHRLPIISDVAEFPHVGGLMSYGVHLPDLFRRAPAYVDKILKGTKPANLPVEQPTRFEMVVNLKTARALGLTIPPSVLIRADQVIR